MNVVRKKGLELAFLIFWFLLAYTIAALVWWFVSLTNQSNEMARLKEHQIRYVMRTQPGVPDMSIALFKVAEDRERNHTKYIAEGATFMLVIFIGAFFVYRLVSRQLRMQQQQQNFMMAVTHELKTPIAAAMLNLETLQKHRLDEAMQQKLLQTTLQETQRLHALTTNILVASQLEGGGYVQSVEELDLSQLTISCIDEYRQRFAERKWEVDIEPDIAVEGDPLLLQIMINNLLENACKYSPKTKPIAIILNRNARQAFLQVKDQGAGIPDEEKKNVFEKFYRIGNEEVRKTKGTGLGLHLCKKIAKDHQADINVTNNLPSGSIFTITFHRINV